MSLKRIVSGIVRSYEGTSDRAKDPKLKTRYYNLSKEQCFDEVSSTLKKIPGFKVLHEVPSVGEITLEKKTSLGRTLDITVSVLGTTPVRSAIDIYSASRGSLGDLGANYRVVLNLYSALDKKMGKHKLDS